MDLSELHGETVFAGLEEYPKDVTLKSGLSVTLRSMQREDGDLLIRFVRSLPENERVYLRDDIINPDMMDARSQDAVEVNALTILACHGDSIIGYARLRRYPFTWNHHLGNIRVTVSPAFRMKGLARTLLGEVFCKALPTGIEKVITEVVRGQDDALNALIRLGFAEEAVLGKHHLDQKGSKHDVIIMSSDLNRLWDMWNQYCESVSGTWDMED